MPSYDYYCEANGRTVEVSHPMSENMDTWGDLCARAGLDTGDTPASTPVKRLITGGAVIGSRSSASAEPPCASGSCCSGGMCGFPG